MKVKSKTFDSGKLKDKILDDRMNPLRKGTGGVSAEDEVRHLREMEKWYIKALKGLNLECSRLEREVARIKDENRNVHNLRKEYEHLKQLEAWYIKALKGLNTMCSKLEGEVERLKAENTRLKEAAKQVSIEAGLSSAEKRLVRFLDSASDSTTTLLKAVLFSEPGPEMDLEKLTALLPSVLPTVIDFREEDFYISINELEKNEILKMEKGKLTIPGVIRKYLRMHMLNRMADESDIRAVMAEEDAVIDFFDIMHERHGTATPEELDGIYTDPGEFKRVVSILLERDIVVGGLNRDGRGAYIIPKELMRTIDSLKIDVIVKKASEKRPDRTELMKRLNIKDPSPEDMDILLEMHWGSRSEDINSSDIMPLVEALKSGDADSLITALKDKDVSIRRFAASALWKIGSKAAIEPLLESLKDSDPYVRRLTVSALWKIGDRDVLDQLIDALDDADAMVRYSVVSYLDFVSDKRAVEPLIRALKDDDSMVRTVAASALGKMKDKRAIGPLVEALSDDNGWVRNCAAEALEKIKQSSGR